MYASFWVIDANGNIIETVSGTNDPDGKIAKENAERKAKENREKEEKVKEKRAAKKASPPCKLGVPLFLHRFGGVP